jgi:protein involved in polysaccharide export with SLBB domain
MDRRTMVCAVGMVLAAAAGLADRTSAQATRPVVSTRDFEDRPSLEAQAANAEAQHRTSEAWLLRSRLQRGDFQDGDRIVVKLLGSVTFSDTVTVRSGKMLPLPKMADLPLEGVLRSELNSRLSSHLARYLRDSSAQATPLLRLAVLGAVRSPGYYYTSADLLLSDVVMKAGGPAPNADVGKMVIRRAGETIWGAQDTRTALSDGLSLDRLHLRAGDEVYVAEQRQFNWPLVLQVGATVLGLVVALVRFH